MNKNDLINFENKVIKEYKKGNTYAPIHLSGGNEKQLIKIFKQIKKEDWVFTTHRSHYHALLKSRNKKWLMSRIIKGYSSHINSKKYKIFSSAIVGGIIPIALGTALAIKLKKGKNKVWCFVGDNASEMGCFWESVKYANNFKLPITYVVENNGIGSNMITKKLWGKQTKLKYPCVLNYDYEFNRPHYGCGEFIKFKDEQGKDIYNVGGMW